MIIKYSNKIVRLSVKQIDSVMYLQKVRKAIYVMRSDFESTRYRFGGIGVSSGNTPVRRLGQCTEVRNGQVEHSWHYVAMVELPTNTSTAEVRDGENALRRLLIGKMDGRFRESCVDKKDLFTANSLASVIKVFNQFVDQHLFAR